MVLLQDQLLIQYLLLHHLNVTIAILKMSLITLNGPAKLMVVNSGVTTLDVKRDVYSEWKQWVTQSNNSSFLQAMRAVGGDMLQDNYFLAPTFFMMNGWRLRPAESNHTLNVIGNIYVDGSTGSPFIDTLGSFNVRINTTTSNIVTTIASGSGVTSQDKTDIIEGIHTVLSPEINEVFTDEDKDDIVYGVETALLPDIKVIMGLVHHNFRFTDQVYNNDGNLTSGKIQLYDTKDACDACYGPMKVYSIICNYGTDKKLTSYKMVDIS